MYSLPMEEDHLDAVIAARNEVSDLVKIKQEQRAALDAEIASLTTEMEGLNLYIARRGVQTAIAPLDEVARWREMPRTDAIVEALHTMDTPCSPKEISDHLRFMGRADDPAGVSRALNRLKERHRVISQGRGLWVPSDTSGQDTSPDWDHEPPIAEERSTDQEGGSDVAARREGATM